MESRRTIGDWSKPWVAYHITKRPGMNGRVWSRIGTAWLNRDGSINIILDSLPLGGKIQIREDDRERRANEKGQLAVAAEQRAEA